MGQVSSNEKALFSRKGAKLAKKGGFLRLKPGFQDSLGVLCGFARDDFDPGFFMDLRRSLANNVCHQSICIFRYQRERHLCGFFEFKDELKQIVQGG